MDIKTKIKKAEELASLASEKYQLVTFQELFRFYLNTESKIQNIPIEEQSLSNSDNLKIIDKHSSKDKLPEAHLIAQSGDFKHQVVWSILRLTEEKIESNVKNVREVIDLELSLKKPSRPYTSNALAKLVPKYLKRRKPTSGKSYVYLPNTNTMSIFDDLLSE